MRGTGYKAVKSLSSVVWLKNVIIFGRACHLVSISRKSHGKYAARPYCAACWWGTVPNFFIVKLFQGKTLMYGRACCAMIYSYFVADSPLPPVPPSPRRPVSPLTAFGSKDNLNTKHFWIFNRESVNDMRNSDSFQLDCFSPFSPFSTFTIFPHFFRVLALEEWRGRSGRGSENQGMCSLPGQLSSIFACAKR